jgi:hypothetical protein
VQKLCWSAALVRTVDLRLMAILSLGLFSSMACGCGRSDQAPRQPLPADAARVLALAQDLEKEGKTKQAFAAYRQVVDHFPDTSQGRAAARRISQAQQQRIRGGGTRKAKSS